MQNHILNLKIHDNFLKKKPLWYPFIKAVYLGKFAFNSEPPADPLLWYSSDLSIISSVIRKSQTFINCL